MIAMRGGAAAAQAAQRRRHHQKQHPGRRDALEPDSSDSSDESSSAEEPEDTRCKLISDITKSNRFSLLVAGMIMLNVVFMGLQANYPDLYLPWSCSWEVHRYRRQLVQSVIDTKAAQQAAAEDAEEERPRVGKGAARVRRRVRRLTSPGRAGPWRQAVQLSAATFPGFPSEVNATQLQLHTITLGGFPSDINGRNRSFLNGMYLQRPELEYRLGHHETYWDTTGQCYLFYCNKTRCWGIGSLSDWAQNQAGECYWGAYTAPDADILDSASLTQFTHVFDGTGWQRISGAGVVHLGTKEMSAPPEVTSVPEDVTAPSTAPATAPSTAPSSSTASADSNTGTDSRAAAFGPAPTEARIANVSLQDFKLDEEIERFVSAKGCEDLWVKINSLFLAFFVVELSFRLITYGCKFFTNEDKLWNIFDFSVVLIGVFDAAARIVYSGNTSSKFVTMIRVVRILRILRVLRLFKQFRKLSMLIRGLLESLTIVFWICMLMAMVMLVYAIFCTVMIGQHADEYEDPEEIRMYFGCIANSTVTLFQFLTLDDWSTITRMVWGHQPIMCPLFLIYVVTVALVVVSLLTGVMAEHMNGVRESEEALEEQERQNKLGSAAKALYSAFKRVDSNGDNLIEENEFVALLKDPEIQAELKHIEMDLSDFEPAELFESFDQDGDRSLTWEEFRDGMQELRKPMGSKLVFKVQASMQRVVAQQSCAASRHSPPSLPAAAGQPRIMTASVSLKIDEVNDNMGNIEESLDCMETELKEFISDLRKRSRARPGK